MTDFAAMAREIVAANRFMVLGTADAAGTPWVTPVWFAHADHRRFVWVSSPDRRHSRNVTERAEVSIAIFDSTVTPGDGRAVYMDGRAGLADLARDLETFNAGGLDRRWGLDDVTGDAPYRLYAATITRHWVLDPDSSPDDRAAVAL